MIPVLSLEIHEDSLQPARVPAAQQLLFPASPRSLCDELGLSWQAALRLQEEGWFSFSLEKIHQLDEAQEAELRCLRYAAARRVRPQYASGASWEIAAALRLRFEAPLLRLVRAALAFST